LPSGAGAVSQRSEGNVTAVLRIEVARLRDGLDRVESALGRLDAATAGARARARPERYYQLLIDVYECGRHGADSATFASLGRRQGYDARGLGGFFVGSRAPLRRAERRVRLTLEGHRLLDDYLTGNDQ
jgi:hypothetical protein